MKLKKIPLKKKNQKIIGFESLRELIGRCSRRNNGLGLLVGGNEVDWGC